MKSFPEWDEQGRKTAGFPVRPLLLSMLLHMFVFMALAPALLPASMPVAASPALRGHLRLAAAPADPVPETHAEVKRTPAPVRSQPAAVLTTTSGETRAPAEPHTVHAVPPAPTIAAAESSGVGATRAPEPVDVAAIARESREEGVDAAGLRQFRLALAGEMRRHRHYPEQARRQGWSGTAEVRVTVDAANPARAELAKSSGHMLLDEAALDMLRKAAPRVMLPVSLHGRSFAVLLPVLFVEED